MLIGHIFYVFAENNQPRIMNVSNNIETYSTIDYDGLSQQAFTKDNHSTDYESNIW